MVNYYIINKCRNKSVILVDFFDTVMFRHIHSHCLMGKWAKALTRKYPEIDEKNLLSIGMRELKWEGGGRVCN